MQEGYWGGKGAVNFDWISVIGKVCVQVTVPAGSQFPRYRARQTERKKRRAEKKQSWPGRGQRQKGAEHQGDALQAILLLFFC